MRCGLERAAGWLRGGSRSRSLRGWRGLGGAAPAARGSDRRAGRTRLCLDSRLLELGRRPSRMGAWTLACAACRLSLGGPCLGATGRRLAHAAGSLGTRLGRRSFVSGLASGRCRAQVRNGARLIAMPARSRLRESHAISARRPHRTSPRSSGTISRDWEESSDGPRQDLRV